MVIVQEVCCDEGISFSETALSKVQDYSATWCSAGDLRKSKAQAKTRVTGRRI